ncbi:RIP metalloprotease RseP [uncultured Tateyamaria sp.]|uniref:RIP metalloprotease RseP n=1 Tax=uncultured Tateyamaria sp. TaxID=455651 RepID=UPI00260697C5|nr:RIP metalloprotease RseP [uncultured Tateyamaria sp.]
MDISALIPAFGGFAWTIFFFVVALSVIVAIHEYGHYIVGRWSGIQADVFSIGFGPVLWSRMDKHGTRWQIAALPFGGYVKFAGDANAASGKDEAAMADVQSDPVALRRTMHGAPLWARAATVAAGPVFNFALSIMVFAIVGYSNGVVRDPLTVGELRPLPTQTQDLQSGDVVLEVNGAALPSLTDPTYGTFVDTLPLTENLTYTVERDGERLVVDGPHLRPPFVQGVSPQSAAVAADIERGDVITAVDGTPIFTFTEIKNAVEGSDGRSLDLTVWRNGAELQKVLTPKRVDEPQPDGGFATQWRIGIASGSAFEPATQSPGIGAAITGGVAQTWAIINGSISGLGHMITGAISTCNLSGPIGIAQVSGTMASQGAQSFIWFIAVLSTAVGLLNLFPIPALDGGHLVFYAYEAVTGKAPSDRALQILMGVGLTLVLSLMVFALGNDLFCP